ncbi:MAG TPA: OmpA family protein [Cryomorphaceae bacterium]|nr:OmpA family protein [Cryomorphaceae bacterium]
MSRIPFLIFVLLMSFQAVAQPDTKPVQLGKTASDCLGALMLNDTVVGPVFSPQGFGNKLEIAGYELGDPYFIEREHNTVWYRFIVPYDAVFTFDLIPNIKEDDFDFLLFQYDGPNFCRDIAAGTKIPVRTNISRKNVKTEGRTGLELGAVNDYVPSGPGSPFSRPIDVKKGEMYYLLVDNPFKENEGHTIYLHYNRQEPDSTGSADDELEKDTYSIPYRDLEINVFDAETKNRIAANIKVEGLPDSLPSRYPVISKLNLTVVSYRSYEISVVKQGYLLASKSFIPKNDSLYTIDFYLKPLKLGDRINLENIKFETDETEILDKSLPALEQLKDFLEINPTISVEIQGHVNGESKRNKRKYRKLSEARAKAIQEKLVEAGISKSRLNVKGFGNAKMLFPTPVNNRQAEANRRVEVEITSL